MAQKYDFIKDLQKLKKKVYSVCGGKFFKDRPKVV